MIVGFYSVRFDDKFCGTGPQLETDHYVLTGWWGGGGGVGKFWSKLYAEAINTEINCMQVKRLFAGGRRQKKMFAVGAAYKKVFASENVPPLPSTPRQTKIIIMVRPLMNLAWANHPLGSVSKIYWPSRGILMIFTPHNYYPVTENTGPRGDWDVRETEPSSLPLTYGENLHWMMNYLWLWIFLKALHCKVADLPQMTN